MKTIYTRLLPALILGLTTWQAQAANYICNVDGTPVFTNKKVGKDCTASQTDGTAEISDETAQQAQPEKINLKEPPGEAAPEVDDIKILTSKQSGSVTNSADAANPRLNIKLRKGGTAGTADLKSAKERAAELNRKAKIIPAPVIAAPAAKSKPQLTRKQILQNEVRNEQAALVRAKAQLSVAQKKGDVAKISRLNQAVKDREANIRAIQGEMRR
ncbi:hypothetical protein [Neisseria chenwenguii]|uniref:Uncharacterized protein n=1 Tax=Neisseria chenwenguii TaxID=1853278 RepID=A0A220S0X8_9NEIS|nr:hypothetical protein [Neisseria chenwenguii]ASK27062.1 hypothetical protein BG910_04275 [Neisseria chenwenguii]ROV56038.1 hypothetical protein EGS38_06105 [Neisseria chenwenguii]